MAARRRGEERIRHLEHLLRSTCGVLQEYYPSLMTKEVREWWGPERNRVLREREERAGVAGLVHEILEEETRDEDVAEFESIGKEEECASGEGD